jgi:hypothetical protein
LQNAGSTPTTHKPINLFLFDVGIHESINQKLGNVFINAQQMVVQPAAYLVFSLLLYQSFRTFQFINIFPFEESGFFVKIISCINELKPNFNDIM